MIKRRIRYLFSISTIQTLFRYFVETLGLLWLLTEVSAFFIDWINNNRGKLFYGFLAFSLVLTIIRAFPRLSFSNKSRASNVEIEIKVGNLLSERSNIAFGCSDCFDSKPNEVIGARSIMAQIVNKSFGGNSLLLDTQISEFLNVNSIIGVVDSKKTFGKNIRYKIGTVAVIPINDKKTFFTVFSTTNNDDKTTTTSKEDLWKSLCELWTQVRIHGFTDSIAIPVWGGGLARVQASRISLIQLTLLSFVVATRENLVSRKLTLIISEEDYDPNEFMEAVGMVKSFEF